MKLIILILCSLYFAEAAFAQQQRPSGADIVAAEIGQCVIQRGALTAQTTDLRQQLTKAEDRIKVLEEKYEPKK